MPDIDDAARNLISAAPINRCCAACGMPLPAGSHPSRKFCAGGCEAHRRPCAACGKLLPAGTSRNRKYCKEICDHKRRPAPAVYRYVCPDGRCYVGSVGDIRRRNDRGLSRSNPWIDEALLTHPAETWRFEILKTLPPACSEDRLRRTEQRYIERFRSWHQDHGFNRGPAWWFEDTPGVVAARARCTEQNRAVRAEQRQREDEWRASQMQ